MANKNTNKTFYFNEVDVKREENPHGLMDFELVTENVLKLTIDGTTDLEKSSISLNKKDITFPNVIEWDIVNESLHRFPLHVEIFDEQGKTLSSFWMTLQGLFTNNAIFKQIPEKTQKIVLTCHRKHMIDKTATLTITSKN